MNRTRDFRSEAPDLKALVLIDMQRCSLPEAPFGVPRMHEVVRSANMAIAACRARNVPIIFTRHRQQKTFIGLGGTSVADDYRNRGAVELVSSIDIRPEDQCLDKQHWSAFRNTDLEDRLSVLPGSQIALAGTSMLSMANWLYESRVTSAKGLDLWLNGEPFGGWIWSRGYEFPYTLESLKRDYEHLIAPVVQPTAASAL